MGNDTAEDDLQFRRMRRRTRWLVALFEGVAAATFIAMVFGVPRTIEFRDFSVIAIAFGAVASVAFLLWPSTIKDRDFSFGRLTVFGVLVVLLSAYLWLLIFELSAPSLLPDVSYLQHLWNRYSEPARLLRLLTQTLEGIAIGAMAFGLFAIPIGIAIAWLVAIFGSRRV
jgi:hypothetical protein